MCLLIIIIFLLLLLLFTNSKNKFFNNSWPPIRYNPNLYPSEIVEMNSDYIPFLMYL